MEYHNLSLEDVYKQLKSSDKGLASEDAKKRSEEFVLNCCSEKRSLFSVGILSNKYLIGAIASSIILQLIVIYTPLSAVFDTVSIGIMDWVYIILISSSILVIIETIKFLTRHKK